MSDNSHNDIPGLPPFPWVIPNAHCTNCGNPLAWVSGVGRLVVRHAEDGSARCPSTSVHIHPEDNAAATALYREMNDRLHDIVQSEVS